MSARVRDWWRQRSGREQRLLLAMAALAALLLVWLAIIRPLGDGLAAARLRLAEAVIAEGRVAADAETVRRIERSVPRRTSQPLAARLRASAEAAGIEASGMRPDGDGVALSIAAVRPPALLGWVARLERAEGLVVERFTARGNADRTLSAELTVRGRR